MKDRSLRIVLPSIVSYLPIIGIMLLIAVLPFHYGWVQRFALYWLAFTYPLDYILNLRWKGWHWTREKWVYVAMILFFLITPIRQLFDSTPPTSYYWGQIDARIAFFVVGLVGIFGISDKLCPRHVGYVMLATSATIFAYILCSVWQPFASYIDFLIQFNSWRREYISSHMLLNLYMNLSLVFGFYILSCTLPRLVKWVVGLAMLVVFTGLMFSEGRTGFVSSLCMVPVLLCYTVALHSKKMAILICLITCLAGAFAIDCHQRISVNKLVDEPRWVIWHFSIDMAKECPFFGYGLSTLSEEYVHRAYEDEMMNEHYINGVLAHSPFDVVPRTMGCIHPHNALLALQLEVGFIGPLLYLAIFLLAGLFSSKHCRIYVWCCVFVILIQSMFEPLGNHLLSIQIALVLGVWLMMSPEKRNTKETNITILSDIPPCE